MRAECAEALMRRPMQSQDKKLLKIKAAGSRLAAVADPQFSGRAFL